MNKQRDYLQDIAEIRSMMEKSSKFLSLSGWAGIMAGIYALIGAAIAYRYLEFYPDGVLYTTDTLAELLILAFVMLVSALLTAIYFSWKNARRERKSIWNSTSRRMIIQMSVPLLSGGLFMLILISKDLIGLILPTSLLFYGLALYNAGNTTLGEVRLMGVIQIALGLLSTFFIEYSLMFWITGFGFIHILYGIYMYFRYER